MANAKLKEALTGANNNKDKGPQVADGVLSVTPDVPELSEWRNKRSAMDIAATSSSYLRDDGPEPHELYGKFTWKIENFSDISKRELRSNVFEVGGYKWYILVYPQGCDVCNHLSLFLCVADYDKLLPGWSHFAQFTIAVVNSDPKKSKYSDTLHRFCKKEHDWGWKKFMELSKVLDGFTMDDTLVIKAQVQVIRDNPNRPFRCLATLYRRELVRVYLTNVENICRRFVEDKREQLRMFTDSMREFIQFWQMLSVQKRQKFSEEKGELILKGLVKRFFNEKEVTSMLVMDALFVGCKKVEEHTRQWSCGKSDVEPPVKIDAERNMYMVGGDIVEVLKKAATENIAPTREDKQAQQADGLAFRSSHEVGDPSKDSTESDEQRLIELGRRTVEIFCIVYIFCEKMAVAFHEAEALKRQEALIREEEEAERREDERLQQKAAAEKEKRQKKKDKKKQKREAERAKKGVEDNVHAIDDAAQRLARRHDDVFLASTSAPSGQTLRSLSVAETSARAAERAQAGPSTSNHVDELDALSEVSEVCELHTWNGPERDASSSSSRDIAEDQSQMVADLREHIKVLEGQLAERDTEIFALRAQLAELQRELPADLETVAKNLGRQEREQRLQQQQQQQAAANTFTPANERRAAPAQAAAAAHQRTPNTPRVNHHREPKPAANAQVAAAQPHAVVDPVQARAAAAHAVHGQHERTTPQPAVPRHSNYGPHRPAWKQPNAAILPAKEQPQASTPARPVAQAASAVPSAATIPEPEPQPQLAAPAMPAPPQPQPQQQPRVDAAPPPDTAAQTFETPGAQQGAPAAATATPSINATAAQGHNGPPTSPFAQNMQQQALPTAAPNAVQHAAPPPTLATQGSGSFMMPVSMAPGHGGIERVSSVPPMPNGGQYMHVHSMASFGFPPVPSGVNMAPPFMPVMQPQGGMMHEHHVPHMPNGGDASKPVPHAHAQHGIPIHYMPPPSAAPPGVPRPPIANPPYNRNPPPQQAMVPTSQPPQSMAMPPQLPGQMPHHMPHQQMHQQPAGQKPPPATNGMSLMHHAASVAPFVPQAKPPHTQAMVNGPVQGPTPPPPPPPKPPVAQATPNAANGMAFSRPMAANGPAHPAPPQSQPLTRGANGAAQPPQQQPMQQQNVHQPQFHRARNGNGQGANNNAQTRRAGAANNKPAVQQGYQNAQQFAASQQPQQQQQVPVGGRMLNQKPAPSPNKRMAQDSQDSSAMEDFEHMGMINALIND